MSVAVPVVVLRGDAQTRGIQQGEQCREALWQFTDDHLCRLNQLSDSPLSLAGLSEKINRYRQIITYWLPEIAQEIDGVAKGAQMPQDLAWLLQLRREVLGYNRINTGGDCTTIASLQTEPWLAQTVDLNGNLDDFIHVFSCQSTRIPSLVLSFAGLLGYLGINQAGLSVGLNMVLGGEWGPGIPPYLAIRHILDNCASVEHALEALIRLPLSSSRSFTLCDHQQVICVESMNNQWRIVSQGNARQANRTTMHTNHFLHQDFQTDDALNIFARNSSVQRLSKAEAFLASGPHDAEACFSLFSAAPVCVANNGDIRRERTVAAAIMLPKQGRLLLRPGNPAVNKTQTFSLSD
ncbi:C45 family autoproteolytic acyltransferase/hydolase [Serratia sp. (in: enterobacteria)]|uniref:C45 family autoproteolytic acyltransferase/hydolase n=1 Tax=Serratia sp. (in: enterobacteria) TaxID=616 RepID=UPI003988EAC7